jgi:hypothetical protein
MGYQFTKLSLKLFKGFSSIGPNRGDSASHDKVLESTSQLRDVPVFPTSIPCYTTYRRTVETAPDSSELIIR